jgi:predicted neutral ceramidase superfamily lipid hydrolase
MGYFAELSTQIGINIWLLIIILIWSVFWKILALWKSARKYQPVWFVLLFFINTIGIFEILYIYVFSEINLNAKPKERQVKKSKKKSKK